VHQKVDGFSASISRTLPAPIEAVYALWAESKLRKKWLATDLTIRKATENRSLRITWPGGANVDVMFYVKGDAKMQLTIQHSRLADPAAVQAQKEFWSAAIARLKTLLP
jgi:uncharacterized protein YndB with AHSA1/START domain